MQIQPLKLPDVVLIKPARFSDDRGYFSETFREDWFEKNVCARHFVQENQSLTVKPGTIRGLHFQRAPQSQGKLIRCVAGGIFDVVVDIRRGSPDFGKWAAVTLTAEAGDQLWIPEGFLHGFCTLVPDTVACYKVTSYYSRELDAGVAWNDPDIGVAWPEIARPELLSPKDRELPALKSLTTEFQFEANAGR
jgi:dTDP-4-dehydrorhamnose 3,5-epimerase